MKKLFILLFIIALILPLYAQEAEPDKIKELDENMSNRNTTGSNANEEPYIKQDTEFAKNLGPPPKKSFNFARQHFELGFDAGAGADNGLITTGELFKKNVEINMSQLANNVGKDGAGLNFDIDGDFFINIMNIPIQGGIWDIGVFGAADGGINFNLPQSLFILMSEGNIKHHSSSGTISASGGVYADTGLNVSAKYENLKIGVKPALYAPLLFIPKSGITYNLKAEETFSLDAEGGIIMYGPLVENDELQFGFDMSLEGEYALYTFLDVGGSLSHIPLAAAQLENGTQYSLDGLHYEISLNPDNQTNGQNSSELDFEPHDYKGSVKVFQPLRFDIYARYKPYDSEFVVVKPNLGFSVDMNEHEGYFNAGIEGQVNLKNLFIVHLGIGYQESIWRNRLGFALNLRAFELDIEGSLRSQNFVGSWTGQGFGLNIGIRFGW